MRRFNQCPALVAFTKESSQIPIVRPQHGGRLELKLAEESPTKAKYTLSIFSPQGDATTDVSVDAASGGLSLDEWRGNPPPAWLDLLARALLRTIVRNKNSDGEWPRRLTRWRPEPRG